MAFLSFCLEANTNLGKHDSLFVVDDIRVEGAKKVEPEAILEKLKVKKGMTLDNYMLRDDIKNVYSMKYFESVEAHKISEKGKEVLLIKVVEKPIISKILFEGNDEVSGDDLKEQIKTKEYTGWCSR